MHLFQRRKPLVVEVEKPRNLGPLTGEQREAILSLQHHPGFQYLLTKLRLQRALLEAKVLRERQKDLVDTEFLKSGIAWAGWLEDQLRAEIRYADKPAPSPATPVEEQEFQQVRALVEEIGE